MTKQEFLDTYKVSLGGYNKERVVAIYRDVVSDTHVEDSIADNFSIVCRRYDKQLKHVRDKIKQVTGLHYKTFFRRRKAFHMDKKCDQMTKEELDMLKDETLLKLVRNPHGYTVPFAEINKHFPDDIISYPYYKRVYVKFYDGVDNAVKYKVHQDDVNAMIQFLGKCRNEWLYRKQKRKEWHEGRNARRAERCRRKLYDKQVRRG